MGDDPVWSRPAFDDAHWTETSWTLRGPRGIRWLRARVDLTPSEFPAEGVPLGVRVVRAGSWELFWDGTHIGSSGVVGRSSSGERPGPLSKLVLVPPTLATEGTHLVALRTSDFGRLEFLGWMSSWVSMAVGDYGELVGQMPSRLLQSLMPLSGFLLAVVWGMARWLVDRRNRASLLLAGVAFFASLSALAFSWRRWPGFLWSLIPYSSWLIAGSSWCYGLSLVAFVVVRFRLGRLGRWMLGVYAVSLPLVFSLDPWYVFLSSQALCMGLLAIAAVAGAWQRRWSLVALAPPAALVLIELAMAPSHNPEAISFLGTTLLLVTVMGLHTVESRRIVVAHQLAELRSSRLELELVRRQLQPHFLMNTLAALSEWLDTSPKTARAMLDALAQEMLLLGRLSQQQLITMGEEIELCRAHLTVMGLRRVRDYRLELDAVDLAAPIPPAVIHTLIENAITHNRYRNPEVVFRLAESRVDGRRSLVFTCPLEDGGRPVRGTGVSLDYVRVRLQESFRGDYELLSGPRGDVCWRTEIGVPITEPIPAAEAIADRRGPRLRSATT